MIEALDLNDVTVVGHSTGGGEVARYIGRHGTKRVAKAVLIAAVPPLLAKRSQPRGPADRGVRRICAPASLTDRAQFYRTSPCSSTAQTAGRKVSQGVLDQFWPWSMQSGLRTRTNASRPLRDRLHRRPEEKFDVPTLLIHGEDDQVVPVGNSMQSARHHQGRQGHLLPGRAARHHRHAPGPGQRRPARLPAELIAARREGRSP